MISQEQLRQLFDYNPSTGVFTHKPRRGNSRGVRVFNSRFAGQPAGSVDGNGYHRLKISTKAYKAHRIAYFYVYGEWPPFVDHINGVKDDNRIDNLRKATNSQNSINCRLPSRNTSGVRGVSRGHNGRWLAELKYDGKYLRLGAFDTLEEAQRVRERAEDEYHKEYAAKHGVLAAVRGL